MVNYITHNTSRVPPYAHMQYKDTKWKYLWFETSFSLNPPACQSSVSYLREVHKYQSTSYNASNYARLPIISEQALHNYILTLLKS